MSLVLSNKMFFAAMVLLLLAGCGYRLDDEPLISPARTISVPYIEGDCNGELTGALIYQLSSTGGLCYRSEGGEYELAVRLIDFREENIGFRYDRTQLGELTTDVIPAETRLRGFAEVIVRAASGEIVLGPDRVTASIDYDHEYYSDQGRANVFSLGQLNDIDIAQETAHTPLYRALAKAIAQHVIHSW